MNHEFERDNLEHLLAEHQAIRQALPNAWNPFFARFRRLRPVQRAVIPRLLSGANLLLTAPTASGKTEAVIAPLCERLVRNRWRGLSILLITPTRALVNDLYSRLQVPCEHMGVRLGRKTADHALSERVHEQLLITTPESTESLLTFRKHALDDLRALVIDEIHLLDGTPRGDQLRLILSRLRTYSKYQRGSDDPGLQSVALSATVPDPARTAAAYLSAGAEIVCIPGERELEARILVASGDEIARVHQTMEAAADFGDVYKVLVFVNSRRQVDTGTEHFRHERFPGMPVYGHHGSLSKAEREDIEQRFKSEPRAICVATMTLEVGIDIGDVDLVVCMDPPFSLSSFLQRIGRGCRRMQGKTRVLCVARDRFGELVFDALIRQARLGLPPAGPVAPLRRSVLLQQILAYLRQVDRRRRSLNQLVNVFTSTHEPPVPRCLVESVLADMVQSRLLVCRNNIYEPDSRGNDFIESNRIYSNIPSALTQVALIDAETGRLVATVAEFGPDVRGLRIGGRSFDVLPGECGNVRKVRSGGDHTDAPRYHARCLAYSGEVGSSLRNCLGLRSDLLAVIERGDITVVFTWLGQLLNLCLAEGIQSLGSFADDRSFALILKKTKPEQTLSLLRSAVDALSRKNPLGEQRVEQVVDLGGHFEELTDDGKRYAREDWLDLRYLRAWVDGLRTIKVIAADNSLGADLLTLAEM